MESDRKLLASMLGAPSGDFEQPIQILTEDVETHQATKEKEQDKYTKIILDLLKEKEKTLKKESMSVLRLIFFGADWNDKIFIMIGIISSIISGYSMPVFAKLFGDAINIIIKYDNNLEERLLEISDICLQFAYTAAFVFTAGVSMISIWIYIGNRTLKKIKVEYFNTIMKQEQKWFDQTDVYQYTTKVQTQCTVIEHGVN
jgi:ABC-type multidrug transport system fused ATPase/permease subunit